MTVLLNGKAYFVDERLQDWLMHLLRYQLLEALFEEYEEPVLRRLERADVLCLVQPKWWNVHTSSIFYGPGGDPSDPISWHLVTVAARPLREALGRWSQLNGITGPPLVFLLCNMNSLGLNVFLNEWRPIFPTVFTIHEK